MRHDLDELKENERQLDALINTMKEASKRQSEARHAYVTCHDLHNIDMYKDQMIMVVKAPSESQLILMDGDPPPIVLKSEKDEIDIFFCPDPTSGGGGGLHPAAPDTSDDDELPKASTSSSARRSTSAKKLRNLGSAQRNLSKAFDEMAPRSAAAKSNLFNAFNATVKREPSTEDDDDEEEVAQSSNNDTEDDDLAKPFRTSAIKTQKDLMLINEPTEETDQQQQQMGIKKDVKLSIFSPQKSQCGSAQKWDLPEIESFSPSFFMGPSDDRFFPLEPDAEYNFLLADSEGIADLFDYKI
jgi:E2F transcription factor CC-MB domain